MTFTPNLLTTLDVPTLKQNCDSFHSNFSSKAPVTSSKRNKKIGSSSISCSKFLATERILLPLVMTLKFSLKPKKKNLQPLKKNPLTFQPYLLLLLQMRQNTSYPLQKTSQPT